MTSAPAADFSIDVEIAAPAERVWAVMRDVERWHEWTASVSSIRLLGGGPLRVGSRALIKQPKFPPALWRATAIDEGRSFTWVSRGPALRVTGRHAVRAAPGGSVATLSLRYEGLIGRLLARMTRGITERYIAMEAAGLKKRSERR